MRKRNETQTKIHPALPVVGTLTMIAVGLVLVFVVETLASLAAGYVLIVAGVMILAITLIRMWLTVRSGSPDKLSPREGSTEETR